MSTLYLIESTNTVLNNSKIEDTVNITAGDMSNYYPVRGSFGVLVPFDVPMDGLPTDLGSLITKKYNGMLSIYPGYTNILFDEQVDATGWNYAASTSCFLGERQSVGITGNPSALLVSNMTTLNSSPTSFIFRFEHFSYFEADDVDLATEDNYRLYQEWATPQITCEVSFNNGADWSIVASGVLSSVALAEQGDEFMVRFYGNTNQRINIGSWALIY